MPTKYSFEVFPPKKFDKDGNPVPIETIYKTLDELKFLCPDFISVTYGAGGGGNCENTLSIVKRISDVCGVDSVAHLPCVNLTRNEAKEILIKFKAAGVKNILALRGDKVPGVEPKKDFLHASDLIKFIKEFDESAASKPFKIFCACYPEKHFEAQTLSEDIDNLKRKVDYGANHILSQLFFDNSKFYEFIDMAQQKGIDVPIEAGIMPATNEKSIKHMVEITGASLPKKFTDMMEHFRGDKDAMMDAGINYAIDQITDLITHGVDGIHLYTMNNTYVAKRITRAISTLLQRGRLNDDLL